MDSKKTEPESEDAEVKKGTGGETAGNEAADAIPVIEQIDDSELPQSIKDRFRNRRKSEPE